MMVMMMMIIIIIHIYIFMLVFYVFTGVRVSFSSDEQNVQGGWVSRTQSE